MMDKKEIKVGSKVKFNKLPDAEVFVVTEMPDQFTLKMIPDRAAIPGQTHRVQTMDICFAILA